MVIIRRLFNVISSLRFAISIFIIIGISSSLGTIIPQGESEDIYINAYKKSPLLGIIRGETILNLNLDHIYSSVWFLSLFVLLTLSLTICSFKRQLPVLISSIKWIDYKNKNQLNRLAISEEINCSNKSIALNQLAENLRAQGWAVNQKTERLAARKGVVGRLGPILIHIGMILLMLGAALGALNGQHTERFLSPGKSFKLISQEGKEEININLDQFKIERDSAGRTEQFRSQIIISEKESKQSQSFEASVNHPIRYKGLTIYQADWSLSTINIQIDEKDSLTLPLRSFPELGDQIWGIVIPTNKELGNPILLTMKSEQGPVKVFDEEGVQLASLIPGEASKEVKGIPIGIKEISTSSGLLLKYDPGVPIVYSAFAIILIGGILSIISTKQIWIVTDPNNHNLYLGAISNRDTLSLENELPKLISLI